MGHSSFSTCWGGGGVAIPFGNTSPQKGWARRYGTFLSWVIAPSPLAGGRGCDPICCNLAESRDNAALDSPFFSDGKQKSFKMSTVQNVREMLKGLHFSLIG